MKGQTWLITGASGLIGTELSQYLRLQGHAVKTVGRSPSADGTESFRWDPAKGEFDDACLQGVDVVVHLAGANVGKRWTKSHRRAILESRTSGTSLLKQALVRSGFGGTLIQASAIGFYGNATKPVDESSPKGEGFLADVVEQWERETTSAPTPSCRVVHMRLGLVLAPQGGTLSKMLPIYKLGMGSPLGSGQQSMSWIHVKDVVGFLDWAAQTPSVQGTYNLVAPTSTTNALFSSVLASALRRPHWAPNVPAWLLKFVLGEMASLVLDGQSVVPRRLLDEGFAWKFPALHGALTDCVETTP